MSALGAPVSAAASAILDELNDEQRAAVTHGAGPLLIVAGAGTGKTAVLTRRIAWLIAEKRARPEEILALTFTDKAAAEMESRVDVLVPYGFVGATLSTFHAFGDRLVRDHAIELGLTSQLRVGSRADLLVFLRERLFELGLERFLPLGRPDQHLDALLTVFDRARDEDVSPEHYLAFAAALAAAAGDDPEKRDRAAAELEKARVYQTYQRLLFAHGRVDFSAQISLALRLLRERPYLRREYQERFRFILVDEFQDTNHVQFELLKLLAGPNANLTVVGDDDQSIYRFRGAKIENLLGFLDVYPHARVLVLRRNYRSGQRILDLAHRMVRHNDPERLEARDPERFAKRLVAARAIEGEVVHWAFETGHDEADAVASEIAATVRSGARAPREIAILGRTHVHLDPFAFALRAQGVRFQRANQRGLYQRPEVLLCLNALRTVANPADSTASYAVLGDPLFGVDPVELATLSATARRTHRPLLELAGRAAHEEGALSPGSVEAILRFVELNRRLLEIAPRRPTSDVLYALVSESGLLGQLSATDTAEAAEQMQNLNKLFGIVTRVGPLLISDRVPDFIGHLDLLIDAGDDPQAAVVDPDDDAVQLLTAHNAKGLEFSCVYLVQLIEGRFPMKSRTDPLPFPPELDRRQDPKAEHEREERRLFYVGMTRARDRLVLTHAADVGGKRTRKVSRFVVEALELSAAPRLRQGATASESIARHAPAPSPPPPTIGPLPEDRPLELSHGRIDDYLTCPWKYRYAHVMQVPIATDPRAMYGIAIHNALNEYLQRRVRGLPVDADAVLQAFEHSWSSEGFYSREHEERRLAEGRAVLHRFVAREEGSGRTPLGVELPFKFHFGSNVVSGRWDRIDEGPAGIVLVDYKTSQVEDPVAATERARRSARTGQLGLYALAYHETRGVAPARVQLSYVSTGSVGEAMVDVETIDAARLRISEAAAGIRAAQFPAKPDPVSCRHCPFNRFCPYRSPGLDL
ncbi:MAG TPA: ATP-dependent DNA helicase [Candidatus Limnocylindria bacterium]|nr:ATP-dependent DNA helicase [Candidatus Limnocylindria bacterium]